jgi:hypothetical protein
MLPMGRLQQQRPVMEVFDWRTNYVNACARWRLVAVPLPLLMSTVTTAGRTT